MDTAAKWVRRFVAIIVAVFSFAIFVPVGGFFYVFLLTRSTVSLTLASFLSAMTGRPLAANIQGLLHHSVSFFPTGLEIIWAACRSIWLGESNGQRTAQFDAITLLTNVILAILFFVIVMAFLDTVGMPVLPLSRIFGWLFGTPTIALLLLAGLGLVGFFVWHIFRDSWRQFTSGKMDR